MCLKFPDNSMYYGEMAYFNEFDEVMEDFDPSVYDEPEEQPKEEEPVHKPKKKGGKKSQIEEEPEPVEKPKKPFFKRRRHGKGMQVFYRPDKTIMCKYEGYWHNGEKHGWGKIDYPDGSYYYGELEKGVKNGRGKY